MPSRRRSMLLGAAGAVALLGAGPAGASPVRDDRAAGDPAAPWSFFDARRGTARGPRLLARRGGTLSRPARGAPAQIAERYARDHAQELGLAPDDLRTLRLAGSYESTGGIHHVRYRQYAGAIPSFDGELRVSLTRDGSVFAVSGTPQGGFGLKTTTPSLAAAGAMRRLMDDVGIRRRLEVRDRPSGARRRTVFEGGDSAALVAFGTGTDTRLAWELDYAASPLEHYTGVVDAATGEVLYRSNNVVHATDDASVWEKYPGALRGGTPATKSLTPYLTGDRTKLIGPNAHVYSDFDSDNVADSGENVGRRAGADFAYPFTHFSGTGCPGAVRCGWDHAAATSWRTNRSQTAVQAFYFVNRFHDHLKAAPVSFDDTDGPYGTFEGTDRMIINTQDGAAKGTNGGPTAAYVNQAFMEIPKTGASPRMTLRLYGTGTAYRDVSSADDAAIVYHEYTHGMSTRLVPSLDSLEGIAMGEAWSDFYAMDYLVAQFPQDNTTAVGEVDFGRYVDAAPHSIRREALDCPVGAAASSCPGTSTAGTGGFTYGDVTHIGSSYYEPHDNGEVWAQTLWDLRGVLGSSVSLAVVTEGMRLTPGQPTFLDARDAILLADHAIYGSADHAKTIWEVFTHRGMGSGATDSPIKESYDRPATGPLTATPSSAVTGQSVRFDASKVRAGGKAVGYDWDLDGNGTYERKTTTAATSFAYTTARTYTAKVRIRYGDPGTSSASVQVVVKPAPAPTPTPAAG